MHTFKDANGKVQWQLEITVSSIRRVRALAGVDLLTLVKDGFKPLGELVGDAVRLADVLWALVQPQAERLAVSDEDFGRALYGDVIALAAEAFVEELVDFFPDAKARANLRRALTSGKQAADILMRRATVELEKVNPEDLAQT